MDATPTAQAATTAIDDEVRGAYARVAEFLEPRIDELAAELTELYRQELPHYADVPAWTAHQNNRATLLLAVRRWERGERSTTRMPTRSRSGRVSGR
jgi:hypothetical protein